MSKMFTVKKNKQSKQRERKLGKGLSFVHFNEIKMTNKLVNSHARVKIELHFVFTFYKETSTGDYSSVKENENEIVDVSRMTFVESVEVRLDELQVEREKSSKHEFLHSSLDSMKERLQAGKNMAMFHELELKNQLTLTSKAIGIVEIPSVREKESPLKIEDSEDVAQFAKNAQAAFDPRLETLKEKKNINDGFFSDFNQKIREDSERMEKEIEEFREQIKREGNSSILKFGPPQDDEQDEFQLSEVDKQAAEEVLVTLAQETKEIRAKQNAEKELRMSSLEQAKHRTAQKEKISSLKSEKVKQMKKEAEGKLNATMFENKDLQMKIEEQKKMLALEREEIEELEKEEQRMASLLKKQEEENIELDHLSLTASSKLDELYAEDSRVKEEKKALYAKEKELEAHKLSLNHEFAKLDSSISENWSKSVTMRRKIHEFNVEISEFNQTLDAKKEDQKQAEDKLKSALKEVEDLEEKAKQGADAVTNKEEELEKLVGKASSLTKEIAMDDQEAENLANDIKQAIATDEEILQKKGKLAVFHKVQH